MMTNKDREKLCADLLDPWRISMEGGEQALADLAAAAAGEIEALVAHNEKLAREVRFLIEQQLRKDREEAAPASVTRWWARSKREAPATMDAADAARKAVREWVKHRIKHIEDTIAELEAKQNSTEGWGAAVGARAEWLRELRGEALRLREGREPTRHHAGLPPLHPYPAEESEAAK